MAASFPKLRTVLFLLLLTSPIHGQSGKRFALLPQGEISAISRLCSRNGPKVNGSWEPTDGQIKSLEQHLSQISRLKSEEGMVGIQIAKPSRYYRQYVGIVVGGRKLIYLNAFDTIDQPPLRLAKAAGGRHLRRRTHRVGSVVRPRNKGVLAVGHKWDRVVSVLAHNHDCCKQAITLIEARTAFPAPDHPPVLGRRQS
jgi:hypothetical protein